MSIEQRQRPVDLDVQIDEAIAGLAPDGVEALLQRAVMATLQNEESRLNQLVTSPIEGNPVALTLLLTGDDQLQRLNHEYLDIDRPTDVLSFPDGAPLPDGEGVYLGDIAISVERAQQQAAAAGHNLTDELLLLAVHGTLHLLGHDHADAGEKAAMWASQSAVLGALGVSRSLASDEG